MNKLASFEFFGRLPDLLAQRANEKEQRPLTNDYQLIYQAFVVSSVALAASMINHELILANALLRPFMAR